MGQRQFLRDTGPQRLWPLRTGFLHKGNLVRCSSTGAAASPSQQKQQKAKQGNGKKPQGKQVGGKAGVTPKSEDFNRRAARHGALLPTGALPWTSCAIADDLSRAMQMVFGCCEIWRACRLWTRTWHHGHQTMGICIVGVTAAVSG